MFVAKEFESNQQFPARNSSYLDHMAILQREQNHSLPFLPSVVASNGAFPGRYGSDFCGPNTGQHDTAGGFLKLVYPYCNISHPTRSLFLNDAQCAFSHGIGVADNASNTSYTPWKMFLIFDQSMNHTKLFFSPPFSSQNQVLAYKTPTNANGLPKEAAGETDQQILLKPVLEEDWGENDLTDGEVQMHEDTEEINALLYSDSDDNEENDEVTSTGHSLFIIEEGHKKDGLLHEDFTDVVTSDQLRKRQRLPDGKYKKSSSTNAKSPMNQPVSQCYVEDVDLSCAGDAYSHDECKREKKVKIRQALMTLASIIPGLNNKDPLSIIDEAIIHLKSMKTEAEKNLQLSHQACSNPPLPSQGSLNLSCGIIKALSGARNL